MEYSLLGIENHGSIFIVCYSLSIYGLPPLKEFSKVYNSILRFKMPAFTRINTQPVDSECGTCYKKKRNMKREEV